MWNEINIPPGIRVKIFFPEINEFIFFINYLIMGASEKNDIHRI